MNYLKPNFKIKHPANLLGLLFVFLFSFSVAYPVHAQTDNDHGTYIPSNGLSAGQQAKAACKEHRAANASSFYLSGTCALEPANSRYIWQYSTTDRFPYDWVNNYFNFNESATECPSGESPDSTGKCTAPVEPQNCQELSDSQTEPEYFELPKYAAIACYQGCAMEDVGGVVDGFESGGKYKSNYQYTGDDCSPGEYNPDAGLDVYQHDEDLQNCYDSKGRLIGQISKDLSCPQLDICYDQTTGNATGTTSQSTSCSSGVKYNDLSQEVKESMDTKEQSTSTETLPDGTVVEQTETTTTETGLDGSTSKTVKQNTTTFGTDGSETSETSEKKTTEKCTGPDCKEKQSISNLTSCDKSFICKGDFFACNQMKLEREKACSFQLTEEKVNEWKNSTEYKEKVFGDSDVDANGQLTALQGGDIDITGTINTSQIFNDDGQTASCPAPIQAGKWQIDISPFCQFFEAIRYAHLLFEMIAILWFLRRSLVEVE